MNLVGFVIRIYHDERSPERKSIELGRDHTEFNSTE